MTIMESTNCPLSVIPEINSIMTVGSVIGEGTFSTVYEGNLLSRFTTDPDVPEKLALKHITQLADPHIQANELRFLTQLKGENNVVRNLFAVRHRDSLVLVMPYYHHDKFSKIIKKADCDDIRDYIKNLLIALRHIHAHGIIHRDIKPNNFLYCTQTKRCAVVDFGLAQLEESDARESLLKNCESKIPLQDCTSSMVNACESGPRTEPIKTKVTALSTKRFSNACQCQGKNQVCRGCLAAPCIPAARAGTAGYRPPEVLLKCLKQTTAVDMWACGVIFLSLLSGRSNFFNAPDDLTNLGQLVALLGKNNVCKAAREMGKNLLIDINVNTEPPTLKTICERLRYSNKFKSLKTKVNQSNFDIPDSAYNLLERLLKLNPKERITATEALEHPFILESTIEQD